MNFEENFNTFVDRLALYFVHFYSKACHRCLYVREVSTSARNMCGDVLPVTEPIGMHRCNDDFSSKSLKVPPF